MGQKFMNISFSGNRRDILVSQHLRSYISTQLLDSLYKQIKTILLTYMCTKAGLHPPHFFWKDFSFGRSRGDREIMYNAVADLGEGPGGGLPPLIPGSGWPSPPYLKVLIRHCKVCFDKCPDRTIWWCSRTATKSDTTAVFDLLFKMIFKIAESLLV